MGMCLFENCFVLAQETIPEGQKPVNQAKQKPDFLSPEVTVISRKEPLVKNTENGPEEPALSADVSGMEIKRLNTKQPLYSFELRDVEVKDLFRVLAHDYKLNLLVDKDVEGKVTASLSSVSLEEALDTIADSLNLVMEKKGTIIKVSPNLVIKTFVLKYIEAKKVLEQSSSSQESQTATTTSAASSPASAAPPPASAAAPAQYSTSTASNEPSETGGSTSANKSFTIYDLISSKGIILLGQQPNSITVIDYPPNLERIEEYLNAIDQRMTSRVFKLKFLKAKEIVGATSSSSQSATDATGSAAPYGSSSSSSSSGQAPAAGQ
jgi:type II secretory pathway component GspD/PulD (secretin)